MKVVCVWKGKMGTGRTWNGNMELDGSGMEAWELGGPGMGTRGSVAGGVRMGS